MKSPDINTWAASIWDATPGTYKERAAHIEKLIPALKAVVKADRPITHRWAKYADEQVIVASLIGKRLGEISTTSVLLCGYPTKITFVLEIAENANHPLYAEARKFVERHSLTISGGVLKVKVQSPGKKG